MYDANRISTCPVTVHGLLHIPDGIVASGPVWASWAFPTERYCGLLGRCIKSKRHPFANLDAHCVSLAQLTRIQNRWDLHAELSLKPNKKGPLRSETRIDTPECEWSLLGHKLLL